MQISLRKITNADLLSHLPRWRGKTRNYTNTTSYPGPFAYSPASITFSNQTFTECTKIFREVGMHTTAAKL